jgi:hypothetical protein
MRTLRVVLSFWRVAYGGGTWRRIGYAVVAVPICVACVALSVVGRVGTAGRYQRSLARGLTGQPAGEAAASRVARVLASSVAGLAIGLVSWAVLQYLALHVFINVGFPLRNYLTVDGRSGVGLGWWGLRRASHTGSIWASTYRNSWGGPTLVGAWAVHAGLVLVSNVPLLLWALRGLTRLQGGLTRTLLGSGASGHAPRASVGTIRPDAGPERVGGRP